MDETTYPAAAVEWLVGTDRRTVLEVGAGAGLLTRQLHALGHDVHATDPSADTVEQLAAAVPDVRASAATAERLPSADASVEVVACRGLSQYDEEAALEEFARVLRKGGHVGLVVDAFDVKIPWVRKFARLVGRDGVDVEAPASLVNSPRFGFVEESQFRYWATVDAAGLSAIALAQPAVASADPAERERVLAAVRDLYADYGRRADGMQLPSIAHCFRATVVEHPWEVPARTEGPDAPGAPAATDDEPVGEGAPGLEPAPAPASPTTPAFGAEDRDGEAIRFRFR